MIPFLILLFMASPLFAETITQKDQFVVYDDWSGGLNTREQGNRLKSQTPDAENGLIDEVPGSIVKRKGMIVAGRNPYLGKINFQFEFVDDAGSHGLFQSDGGTVTYTTDLTNYTVLRNTLTVTAQLRAAQGRGFALFTNGTDAVFISSGFIAIPLDGTNGRANAPRGSYSGFYLERFFLFNTTNSASALYWSSVKSTDGFTYALDSPLSWPTANARLVGENDGAVGSGLDVYRGQLIIGKTNKSIYTLFGNTDATFLPRRTNAHSGPGEQESMTQLDNLLYYRQNDGVYAFDGSDSVRISDDIKPDMDAIAANASNIQSDNWESKSDFDDKGYYAGSTATSGGFLIFPETYTINNLDMSRDVSHEFGWPDVGRSTWTQWIPFSPTFPMAGINDGYISKVYWDIVGGNLTSFCDCNFVYSFRNTNDGRQVKISKFYQQGIAASVFYGNTLYLPSTFTIRPSDLNNGYIQAKIEFDTSPAVGCDVNRFITISSFTSEGSADVVYLSTKASYVSEVSTISAITAWETFDSIYNANGGNISFYVKTDTSVVQISTRVWSSITPGSKIASSISHKFVQWSASFTVTSTGAYSQIDSVSVKHNEGGATDSSPRAIEWKKRYLLMVSTKTDGTSTIIYVKSKITNQNPNAWMKYTFTNDYFKSIVKFNDNLYLGSGSTGTVYRFDYGTNDDGDAINWFYDTPETTMDNIFFKKEQYEYFVDCDQTNGANLMIQTTVDGSSVTSKTVDLSGSGRLIKSVKNVPKIGKYFRYRFYNYDLDKDITFNSFAVRYQMTGVRD